MLNWDHSPRAHSKSLVLNHAEPVYFERHVKDVMKHIEKACGTSARFCEILG
ncbi:hypothetical protein [Bacteroides sp.]|uniref:hypothetical protein n=1 Tax=Bacteroides sp. TaxID=29523 RepID=UPI0025BC177D|nr:hypothetical protein [Bacteroides sp.]